MLMRLWTWQADRMILVLLGVGLASSVGGACGGRRGDGPVTPVDAGPPIDVGLGWVSIPGGEFQMGCRQTDPYCDLDESPLHRVSIASLQLTATLITQQQYRDATGQGPSQFVDCGAGCPVESVSWFDARAFCGAVGGRLPTEAEFEYAARAGAMTPFICGTEAEAACLDDVAWYRLNAGGAPHVVAAKGANGFGLYDMTGNVWEWTEDCYHVTYDGAPANGSAWVDGAGCTTRVLRGSAYDMWLDGNLRVWARVPNSPDAVAPYMGFRCARDVR